MTKDYYKILGIAEFESAENIKIAYRRLARKYHPDVAGETADAISRFKEINEAYEILSNRTKKEEYDRARRFYKYAQEERVNNNYQSKKTEDVKQSNPNKEFKFSWEDFLSQSQSQKKYQKEEKQTPKKGNDIYSDIDISITEAINGVVKTINMLQSHTCPFCKGRKFANGSICNHCQGKGEISEYKKFNIKIPKGISNKSKIRLSGEGEKGLYGGKNGDLYITIHIQEPKDFRIEGVNIYKTLPITPFEAVLGGSIKISGLRGNTCIKLAPNTQNGQKIRLSGYGIVQNEKVGDMILTVEIQIPKKISNSELDLYKKLKDLSSSDIRENFSI